MLQVQSPRRQRVRGSALLLTLLLTITGAAFLGLTVDAMSLVWARSNAQTTANLTAAAVALERERNPGVSDDYLWKPLDPRRLGTATGMAETLLPSIWSSRRAERRYSSNGTRGYSSCE